MSRTNYIFIDFENVHETDLDRISGRPVHVTMMLGEQHKSLPVLLVRKMLKYPGQIELVETGRGGKNALDMVLAAYLGSRKAADPKGVFHIIAKDRGYRALVDHFQADGLRVEQHASLSSIPMLMNRSELCQYLHNAYQVGDLTRPKKRAGMEAQILSQLRGLVSEDDAKALVVSLEGLKTIKITDDHRVIFAIPHGSVSKAAA